MAGLLIGSIPLIVLSFFTSRWFVEGLTSGAIKVRTRIVRSVPLIHPRFPKVQP